MALAFMENRGVENEGKCVVPGVWCLKAMMDTHMISINPESRALKPSIKKTKFKNEQ